MYIESVPNRSSPPAVLLRGSWREGGRVRKRTLANLSGWPPALVEGFRVLLRGGTAVPRPGTPSILSVPFPMATSPRCWERSGSSGSRR